VLRPELFGHDSHVVGGFNYLAGNAAFDSIVELARINPVTRSTDGLGVGTFIGDQATQIKTTSDTLSLYALANVPVTARLTLTAGGRFNYTEVQLRDQSGVRPELDGDHVFERFNPTVGATFEASDVAKFYASYSESARAPTPIELSCNEGVFEKARSLAEAAGEDPDDVTVECRLPNAFLADPPLNQVVAESVEAGVRGVWGDVQHRLGYFRTVNHDDIIFQSTGRSTGLFANVDQTMRQGMELALAGSVRGIDWFMAYSLVDATFESPFMVLSPNHPAANAKGEVPVRAGTRMPGIPQHQIKLGADYRLDSGLALGAELLANGDQRLRGDESNRLAPVDGYAVVNLRGAYPVNPHLEVFARVTNLFDTDYENYGLLGEDPSEVIPGLNDASPRFLGVGAPRAGWVGVRLKL
jgi:outer membrane receptor protein involved in Fe transport